MPSFTVAGISEEQALVIESNRGDLLARAQSLVIGDSTSESLGWEIINGISDLKKKITADFEPARKAADLAKKLILEQRDGHIDKLTEPDRIVRLKLATWDAEKKRIQAEADRKAREAAEVERRRLQAIADEEARIENDRRRKEREEKILAAAIEAERLGKQAVAAAILEEPVEVAPVVVAPVTVAPAITPIFEKADGAGSMVDDWKFRIVNETLIPRSYLAVDESAIGRVVRALKNKERAEATIPGIEVYNEPKPRTSGRPAH